jgi:hypothetical protein
MPFDLTPQIAKRAYELYEQQGRQNGRAVQDWRQAELEIRKPDAKAESKPEAKAEIKPEAKDDIKSESKVETKSEDKAKTPSDLTPEIVKRVHKFYEELGREDVRAVEELDKKERESKQ